MATGHNWMRGAARGALASVLLAAGLAGCSAMGPAGPAETAAVSAQPTAAPTPVDTTPVLDPAGTAEGNLAFFDYVNEQVLVADPAPDGAQFTAALAAAGFDTAAMELTPDRTAVDLEAASVQFSVRLADGCLIGQWGSGVGYHSLVTAVLSSGRCLIGSDRPAG
ncbi:DUF6993 domain-containing protein [Naasia lichenicola]|uniref:DUF6993 domain-containing protein n=1 Tax=Naasia lichenicola TaxID=2565933 RepID=A0A4S4FF77_9MICO|nr:hypothetical protein [Naasia lichenicola]THG28638.1 hypothetical protein E6C64_17745 [Naasia lichenicola]